MTMKTTNTVKTCKCMEAQQDLTSFVSQCLNDDKQGDNEFMLWIQSRVVPALELLCPLGLGKKELVQFVKRLGHGLSYHQLEENETSLCRKKISSISAGSILLPQYIQPYSFPTLAFDNIDMLEETLTGKGTIYRVN